MNCGLYWKRWILTRTQHNWSTMCNSMCIYIYIWNLIITTHGTFIKCCPDAYIPWKMVYSSLHATMQSFNLNSLLLQDMFVRKVTKMIELRKEDSQEVLKGWFTVDQMKSELKWTSILCWIILMHVFFRTMGANWATTTDQKKCRDPMHQ